MPIYEYECNQCNARFERRQGFDEEPMSACPRCTGSARRVIHSVPVLFKGSGFYSTDHGRGTLGNPSRKDGETETKTEAKAETKTEAKAETTTETKVEAKSEEGD